MSPASLDHLLLRVEDALHLTIDGESPNPHAPSPSAFRTRNAVQTSGHASIEHGDHHDRPRPVCSPTDNCSLSATAGSWIIPTWHVGARRWWSRYRGSRARRGPATPGRRTSLVPSATEDHGRRCVHPRRPDDRPQPGAGSYAHDRWPAAGPSERLRSARTCRFEDVAVYASGRLTRDSADSWARAIVTTVHHDGSTRLLDSRELCEIGDECGHDEVGVTAHRLQPQSGTERRFRQAIRGPRAAHAKPRASSRAIERSVPSTAFVR